ncbi:hypothetical protein E2C01_062462 [Portunus trituberculatus]|uniref:Uncharacterized protein n=1 Tax=Portunus trituberculatus TaxID=210409 RepID=A0A5B7HI35_PORTR|nr:hypothetical protein [Portunus trituberculatus]
MRFGGDMAPNIVTTINRIACPANGVKLDTASHTLQRRDIGGTSALGDPEERLEKRDNVQI